MVDVIPPKKKKGVVAGLYAALGRGFVTEEVTKLELSYEGIPGDRHAGATRKSGAREPWYKRGTEMRNERHLSILCPDELKETAFEMHVPELRPEWIGGNLLIEGIPHLSLLPPRTILLFAGGVSIRIDGYNAPCTQAGRAISAQFDGREDLTFAFPRAAKYRRGLVGWVERPGVIEQGEEVTARIWEQWIYPD